MYEELIAILHKSLPENRSRGTLSNSFYEAKITLLAKLDKDSKKEKRKTERGKKSISISEWNLSHTSQGPPGS